MTAREFLAAVLDAESFESWDVPPVHAASDEYAADLRHARAKAGTDESVLTGRGTRGGRPIAVVVNEFRFLGGSIGEAAATRIAAAVARATAQRLPLLAVTASGGTRMQEGTPAFVRMAEIAHAIAVHRSAGLPYLAYLRHPTTGGVFASWGSLAHVTLAEPGALIGFLGPKVYAALRGEPFPAAIQTAENLAAQGLVDAVVPVDELGGVLDRILTVLVDPAQPAVLPPSTHLAGTGDAWAAVQRTRGPGRVGVRDLLRFAGSHTTLLGRPDSSLVLALTRLDGQPCLLIGQDRTCPAPFGPDALRAACDAMGLADELGLPLVTVIDTPGAELSPDAENRGVAREIARCIAALTMSRVKTVSILLGEGTGGAALALFPATMRIAAQSAWLAPLPPEGASAIVFGDTAHADVMARRQSISASELLARGLIDTLVPEIDDVAELARAVVACCARMLSTST